MLYQRPNIAQMRYIGLERYLSDMTTPSATTSNTMVSGLPKMLSAAPRATNVGVSLFGSGRNTKKPVEHMLILLHPKHITVMKKTEVHLYQSPHQ